MARPRFERLPHDRQRQILDVAARHFAADGFAASSLNAILDEAGVSKGAAYYYFDDKGNLFATVVEDALEELGPVLFPDGFHVETFRGPGFWGEVERLYRRQVALFDQRPDVWRTMKAAREVLDEPSCARLAERLQRLVGGLLDVLGHARAAGRVRDDLPLDLLMEMIMGLDDAVDRWLLDHPEAVQADPDLSARTFAVFRGLLEPPGGGHA